LFPPALVPSDAHEHSNAKITYAPACGFALLLIAMGLCLTLAPEFVYLRDNFGGRINTVFKFYYQAWTLWSIAASYAVFSILVDRSLPRPSAGLRIVLAAAFAISILAGLMYSLLGIRHRAIIETGRSRVDQLYVAPPNANTISSGSKVSNAIKPARKPSVPGGAVQLATKASISAPTLRSPPGFNMPAVAVSTSTANGTNATFAKGKLWSRFSDNCRMSSPGNSSRCGALNAVRHTASQPAASRITNSGMPDELDSSSISVTKTLAHIASEPLCEYQNRRIIHIESRVKSIIQMAPSARRALRTGNVSVESRTDQTKVRVMPRASRNSSGARQSATPANAAETRAVHSLAPSSENVAS
jgi:hypothetical protein